MPFVLCSQVHREKGMPKSGAQLAEVAGPGYGSAVYRL
jgi:hypothetical protein